VAGLIRDLDSDDFEKREAAEAALTKLGEVAAPALRHALTRKLPLEQHRRIERLLSHTEERPPRPEEEPLLRAVWALEEIATLPARRLLEQASRGTAPGPVRRAAKDALRRLAVRSP
jgi:hypothetical protein